MNSSPIGKILTLVLAGLALIAGIMFVKVRTVHGNEAGVLETWSGGVDPKPLPPKTYVFFPGFTNSVYTYDMGMMVYVMNDKNDPEEVAEGRKSDAYVVQSADQQDMHISLRVQWRRKLVTLPALHQVARDQVEERILRPLVLNIVKNQATTRTALDAYSGPGLVKLQGDILTALQTNAELNQYLTIEAFVIEHIGLDPKYTGQIVDRQVAVQERLKNIEQTKAAEAAADKAKAVAQADYEQVIVAARRDKEKGILEAERAAQQQVLAAEASAKQVGFQATAEKNRNVLIATGEKEAALNRAQAIEAIGKAEADALKLRLGAYAAQGAEGYVRIQVAQSMATAFQNIKGYLPEKMTVNTLAENYEKGVSLLVGTAGVNPATAATTQ